VQFHRLTQPRTPAEFAAVGHHWQALGWEPVPAAEEPAIREAWGRALQPGRVLDLPRPRRVWTIDALRTSPPARLAAAEAEFTLRVLSAFRAVIPGGERLLAIDWQHRWFRFDPHGGVSEATRDEWAMPVVPLGDSYHFVAPDFRFGVSGDCVRGHLTAFGAGLVDALSAHPPQDFDRLCPSRLERD